MSLDLTKSVYHHLSDDNTERLKNSIASLVDLQRKKWPDITHGDCTIAQAQTSPALLKIILSEGRKHSDIVVQRSLSNCLAYNFDNVDGAIMDGELAKRRLCIDTMVKAYAEQWFETELECENTGHFWYPPGAYMSWHTNARTPGWRLYLTLTDEAGKSFFRYRDPHSAKIKTSHDNRWDLRLFKATAENPLWHCVYSETHRFSLGYKLTPKAD